MNQVPCFGLAVVIGYFFQEVILGFVRGERLSQFVTSKIKALSVDKLYFSQCLGNDVKTWVKTCPFRFQSVSLSEVVPPERSVN